MKRRRVISGRQIEVVDNRRIPKLTCRSDGRCSFRIVTPQGERTYYIGRHVGGVPTEETKAAFHMKRAEFILQRGVAQTASTLGPVQSTPPAPIVAECLRDFSERMKKRDKDRMAKRETAEGTRGKDAYTVEAVELLLQPALLLKVTELQPIPFTKLIVAELTRFVDPGLGKNAWSRQKCQRVIGMTRKFLGYLDRHVPTTCALAAKTLLREDVEPILQNATLDLSKRGTARCDQAAIQETLERTKPELGWNLVLRCCLETASRPSEILNLRKSQARLVGNGGVEFLIGHKNEWRKNEKKTLLITGEAALHLRVLIQISSSDCLFTASNIRWLKKLGDWTAAAAAEPEVATDKTSERRGVRESSLRNYLKRLGATFSPYAIRRWALTAIAEATGRVRDAQVIAGHQSERTTQHYIRAGDAETQRKQEEAARVIRNTLASE
jgi:integrase